MRIHRLAKVLLLLLAACDETPSQRASSPDDLLSRYAQDGVADAGFCLLVKLVCGSKQYAGSAPS